MNDLLLFFNKEEEISNELLDDNTGFSNFVKENTKDGYCIVGIKKGYNFSTVYLLKLNCNPEFNKTFDVIGESISMGKNNAMIGIKDLSATFVDENAVVHKA